jgi:hypothetical protein
MSVNMYVDFADYLVARNLNLLYIIIDCAFLVGLAGLLFFTKRKLTLLFAIAGGILYFIVDYGIFYLALGTREVIGANTFWFLLWLSMSYGFTNFAWIWLWLNKDKRLFEWSFLIISAWFTIALLAQNFGSNFPAISISRGVGSYHGVMALILFVSYGAVVVHNILVKDNKRISIVKLLIIGITVQLSWETVLLITGIRPIGWIPLVVNSLLETNLGIPALYFIHKKITSKYSENLRYKTKIIENKTLLPSQENT